MRPARGEPLRCPADGSRLVEVERVGVLIDACPECRGVWLDRGELDRILVKERTAMGAGDDDFFHEVEGRRGGSAQREPRRDAGVPPPPRGREDDRRRRRRSILEELLDF